MLPFKSHNAFNCETVIIKLYKNYCVVDGVIIDGYWKSIFKFQGYDGETLQISEDIVTYEKFYDKIITYSKWKL